MTGNDKDLLKAMLDAMPADQRLTFLERVISSLPEAQFQQLRDGIEKDRPGSHGSTPDEAPDRVQSIEKINSPPSTRLKTGHEEGATDLPEPLAEEIEKFSSITKVSFDQDKNRMKREMVGCVAIAGALLAIIVLIAVAGRQVWEFFLSLF